MKIFDGRYDPDLTCAIADEYQNDSGDRELLDEFLRQVGPLIGIVATLEFTGDIQGENREALKCDALTRVFELVEAGELPTEDGARNFTAFLYTTIKRAMIDSLRRSSQKVYEGWAPLENLLQCRLPTHGDVEASIYLTQVREIVRSLFEQDCRFGGKENEACQFMALCLLGYLKQDPMSAQHRFRLTRARTKMLLTHAKVLVKTSLYLFKDFDESP